MESDEVSAEKKDLQLSANSAVRKVSMWDNRSGIEVVVLLVFESAVATAAVTASD